MKNLSNFVKETNFLNLLLNLKLRWDNEKGYEDFKEYEKVIKNNIPKGAKFIQATKRPFGVKFTYKTQINENIQRDTNLHLFIKIQSNKACLCCKNF